MVFASQQHDLEALTEAIAERSGRAPLIGCSTAGEIATGSPADAGVVVRPRAQPDWRTTRTRR